MSNELLLNQAIRNVERKGIMPRKKQHTMRALTEMKGVRPVRIATCF